MHCRIVKLEKYYTLADNQGQSHSVVATVLDPRMDLRVLSKLLPGQEHSTLRSIAKALFSMVWSEYDTRQRNLEAANGTYVASRRL